VVGEEVTNGLLDISWRVEQLGDVAEVARASVPRLTKKSAAE